jgi:hypothetical protein
MPAAQAHPQVNPAIAGLDAVLTDVLVGLGDLDLVKMRALLSHDMFSLIANYIRQAIRKGASSLQQHVLSLCLTFFALRANNVRQKEVKYRCK